MKKEKRDIRELPAAQAARHGGLKKVGNTARKVKIPKAKCRGLETC